MINLIRNPYFVSFPLPFFSFKTGITMKRGKTKAVEMVDSLRFLSINERKM
jgi:hypothetical protein